MGFYHLATPFYLGDLDELTFVVDVKFDRLGLWRIACICFYLFFCSCPFLLHLYNHISQAARLCLPLDANHIGHVHCLNQHFRNILLQNLLFIRWVVRVKHQTQVVHSG